ncbi:sensor histidine kinase [uncultured Polaribacter sp.]|uniref:sensor histidine kinase n=1 Tax=uncultured Polaribacter sp. TaxID=174711 RepID=UPI00260D4A58|nr:sensor histidine kinase [uncultured Polaribacter sp.]
MFDYNQILYTLENPNKNGILIFVIGFLFALSFYHILLFIQNKDKVYFYYGLYTSLILLAYLNLISTGFFALIVKPFLPILNSFEVFLKWLFAAVYFIFAFEFVELKKYSKKWYKIIFYSIYGVIAIGCVIQVISLIIKDISYIFNCYFLVYIPVISIISFIGYYMLFKMNHPLKHYIIIGSLVLFVTSIIGAAISFLELLPLENRLRDSIFYFGVIIENIFFSLGLGHKQKLIYEEKNKQKELRLQAILEAQETERSRIARELHDGVVQEIGSVILKSRHALSKLDLLHTNESQELLESLENSNKNLRTISHQMMPIALKELGISSAINDLLENSLTYLNIKHTLELFNISERLPEKIEVTIYRVLQELIHNITKHSKATEVNVQLFKSNNHIILIVEDNGVGFNAKKSKKGIGLLNISSRLNMLNGTVNFESSNNNGTLITIKIPVI